MHNKSIAELAAGLKAKKFSSVELTQHYLDRIKKFDPTLNSIITLTADQAIAAAENADQLIAAGKSGPLTGIPMLH